MMDRTILLVDDEENITAALNRLLRRDGYKILRANSGEEGLALLAQNQVGVIISDQRMPGMSGTEFLTKVRELHPDTVRIVLSGYTELSSVTDAINRGAVYKFLTKPWEDDLLLANVQEAFQRHEMKIENARLTQELQQANDELRSINQALEQRVEFKTNEIVRNMKVLHISQEILEHLPVAVIGIDEDGWIAIANRTAHHVFSAGGSKAMIGEAVRDVLPPDLLSWALSGVHPENEGAKPFFVDGHEIACRCRSMGEFSSSNGVLLIIEAGMQTELFENWLAVSQGSQP
jgi:FixJ family two-component response regulator